jgi:hypothetical protein
MAQNEFEQMEHAKILGKLTAAWQSRPETETDSDELPLASSLSSAAGLWLNVGRQADNLATNLQEALDTLLDEGNGGWSGDASETFRKTTESIVKFTRQIAHTADDQYPMPGAQEEANDSNFESATEGKSFRQWCTELEGHIETAKKPENLPPPPYWTESYFVKWWLHWGEIRYEIRKGEGDGSVVTAPGHPSAWDYHGFAGGDSGTGGIYGEAGVKVERSYDGIFFGNLPINQTENDKLMKYLGFGKEEETTCRETAGTLCEHYDTASQNLSAGPQGLQIPVGNPGDQFAGAGGGGGGGGGVPGGKPDIPAMPGNPEGPNGPGTPDLPDPSDPEGPNGPGDPDLPDPNDPDVPGNGDQDGDGIPDWKDTDDDNDGIPDWQDNTPGGPGGPGGPNGPNDPNLPPVGPGGPGSGDTDGDGIPDWKDTDDDGDGIPDWKDSDSGGYGGGGGGYGGGGGGSVDTGTEVARAGAGGGVPGEFPGAGNGPGGAGGPGSGGPGAGGAGAGVGAGAGAAAGLGAGAGAGAGRGLAATGGMMPMMGGGGAGAGNEQQNDRTTWLDEDEDVWNGDEDDAPPPVIGGSV